MLEGIEYRDEEEASHLYPIIGDGERAERGWEVERIEQGDHHGCHTCEEESDRYIEAEAVPEQDAGFEVLPSVFGRCHQRRQPVCKADTEDEEQA